MKRLAAIFAAGIFLVAAPNANASIYEIWHPICAPAFTQNPAQCVRVKVELYNSQGQSIEWDRMHAYIDADQCQVTLVDGSTTIISGRNEISVSDANWPDVGRSWHMPKGCPTTVHARHQTSWYAKDNIYYFKFDSVKMQNDFCWKLNWYEGTQQSC